MLKKYFKLNKVAIDYLDNLEVSTDDDVEVCM